MPNIAIIGGGMAGLAAAAKLSQQGKTVTLFEAGPNLGGRARGVDYKGLRLDNGQHILLGAYRETLHLLEQVGVTESTVLTRLPLRLQAYDLKDRKDFLLATSPLLPAPLHLVWGLVMTQGVTIQDKYSAIRLMIWMRLNRFKLQQDQSLTSFLAAHQQSAAFIQSLWEPLCLAALNTPMHLASAQVFLNVLRDSFTQKKHDADVLLARTDLSRLISTPIASYLHHNGNEVKTSTVVEGITPTANGYQLKTRNQDYAFEKVILACGPHQLKKFSDSMPALEDSTKHFTYQAITTVYLQYAEDTQLLAPMLGVVNSVSQWLFDRGLSCGQKGLIAVVISAHAPFKQTQAALAATISEEIATLFPHMGKPLWHKVITEKRATFSCEVGLQRPENITVYPNLLIAGDYTAGDYPATIEGAVRSGIDAAMALISKSKCA